MNQMPDAPDGATRYKSESGAVYLFYKLPTPRMGCDRWHWVREGETHPPGAAGHATEGAAVEDLAKFLRLIGDK